MLKDGNVNAMVPTRNLSGARSFYERTLGFVPTNEDSEGAVRYECSDGSWFLLYETMVEIPARHTVINWTIDDIAAEVADLKGRGVEFIEYDLPGLKTVDSIADAPEGKGAWFRDPDGNVLGVSEMAG
jgi:catechol 2,3-dioxygenase-like lactoylglutathione lyase family enzyme